VAVNRERAFEVYAETADGRPALNLPPDLKWRVTHLQQYEAGRWAGRNQAGGVQTADRSVSPVGRPTKNPRDRLPDLGPASVYLSYTLEAKLTRTPPLADPVAWASGDWSPAVSKFDDGTYRSWVHRHDGSVDGAFSFDGGRPQYVQAWAPPPDPGAGPVMRVAVGTTASPPFNHLSRPPGGLARLRAYTDGLVRRWAADGTLPPGVLDVDPDTRVRAPQYHEAIGRALERHLAGSGEFAYTLDLDRKDKGLDPTEDFVLNTKAGHCQRFATALVLMLRTQGVPSQIVLGYRGLEGRGDGWYDVREDHAHAWVEILVAAPADGLVPVWQLAAGFGMKQWEMQRAWQLGGALGVAATPLPAGWQPMRWVTLDPTPQGALGDDEAAGGLLSQARQRWEAVFKTLLLAYNRDSREQAAVAVERWVRDDGGAFYLAGGSAAIFALASWRRRVRRRRAEWANIPDTLRRLTAILGKAGYAWGPGQTAREWARGAGAGLRASAGLSGVAGVPEVVVAAYYADRFGGRPIAAAQRQALDADVRRLATALA
jgi:transglutaminase-like putative cysteine protease